MSNLKVCWKITIETSNGLVCLCSYKSGNAFKLAYPNILSISEKSICDILHVRTALPIYDQNYGVRKWAKFYSKRLKGGGRIWIDQTEQSSQYMFANIIDNFKLYKIFCSDKYTSIETLNYNIYSEKYLDAPRNDVKLIQKYRISFINLLLTISYLLGKIQSLTISSDSVPFTPEILMKYGYSLEQKTDFKKSYFYTHSNTFEMILEKENEFKLPISWISYVKINISNYANKPITSENISKLLDSFFCLNFIKSK